MTRDNNRTALSPLNPERGMPLYVGAPIDRSRHWVYSGRCVRCGGDRQCPKRTKLAAARAWKSLSRRLDVPGVALSLLTVTTGKPSWDLSQRVEQLRKGVRALMQMHRLDAVSAIEWTVRPEGYHVHAHVVFLGQNPWPPPKGWLDLREAAVTCGLGRVVNIQPARASGGLFAARYVLKYVAKGLGCPERAQALKGRRLWNGHGRLSSWKSSPGAEYSFQLQRAARIAAAKEKNDGCSEETVREWLQAAERDEDAPSRERTGR